MIEQVRKNNLVNGTLIKYQRFIFPLIKIIIASGLLYYLITWINYDEIIEAFSNANIYLISLVVILGLLNIYLQYLKWKITTLVILNNSDDKKVIYSLFQGFSAAVFTPARIGEYFGRALVFSDKSFLRVTLATLLDKFFPLLMVSFFGSLSSIFVHYLYGVSIYITISLFIVLLVLFYLIILLIFDQGFWDNFLFNKLKGSKRFSNYFDKFLFLRTLDRNYSAKMIFLSILFYTCYIIQFAILVAAFSHNYYILNYIWSGNLVMFSKTIIPPISFGELGIREGASVFFIQQFGESASVGFNASIFLFFINVLIPSLIGLLFIFKKNND
jgi:uncharacterized protein (TIRG00374 family)